VNDTTGKLKRRFPWVTIALVLFFGVVNGLVGSGVFEFQGGDRHPIQEQHHINGKSWIAFGVMDLTGDGEAVFLEVF
jgi:hypothetical protein